MGRPLILPFIHFLVKTPQRREQGLIFQGSLSLGLLLSLRLYSLATNVMLSIRLSQDAVASHSLSYPTWSYSHDVPSMRTEFLKCPRERLVKKIEQSRHMSSLCLSEICYKHGSLRFQKCFCEVFNETVSLCFKRGLFNMEIWASGISSGFVDLPKLSAAWFKKKKLLLVSESHFVFMITMGPRLPWTVLNGD